MPAITSQPFSFWAIFTNPAARLDLPRKVWKDVGKVFIVAIVLDVLYGIRVYRWVYPGAGADRGAHRAGGVFLILMDST